MIEIFSRISYPLGYKSSDEIFEQFKENFPLEDRSFVVAVADSKTVIILTETPQVHSFVMLLLAGVKEVDVTFMKKDQHG